VAATGDRRLRNAWEGALAGGGDPASSPLYVFGPFLVLLAAEGTTAASYGPAIWLAVATIGVVSLLYRLVMRWVTDGSGGTGLSEDELGPWAAKTSAAITCIEYSLTFLVSVAALVSFIADRAGLNEEWLGADPRVWLAIATTLACGSLVNRGPRIVSYVFGPATGAVLALLWAMMIATVARRGVHLAPLSLDGFRGHSLSTTLGGFVRILAVMTGVEVFANLVASYTGPPTVRSRLAFRSLAIIMGSTSLTMVIVGPAVVALTDPRDAEVSVFTQAMDALLPRPLAYTGTVVSVLVLLSAAAASAIGIQNLFVGLSLRRYAPAFFARANRVGIPVWPVRVEAGAVIACFVVFGTREGTYLAVYAAGVFVLLSMTSWAAVVRLVRRRHHHDTTPLTFVAVVAAALFTSTATVIIFVERFTEGVWIYFMLVPLLAGGFDVVRHWRGDPGAAGERMGRLLARWRTSDNPVADVEGDPLRDFNPSLDTNAAQGVELHAVPGWVPGDRWRVSVPLDGSAFAEHALATAVALAQSRRVDLMLLHVADTTTEPHAYEYLALLATMVDRQVESVSTYVAGGDVAATILEHAEQHAVTLVVMGAHGRTGVRAAVVGSVTRAVVAARRVSVLTAR
jgi:nucleotide-binding universal stress UspA family protein